MTVIARHGHDPATPWTAPADVGRLDESTAYGRAPGTFRPEIRSSKMLLMYEELSRARMRELQEQGSEARRARRLVAARRWQRRAEVASRNARRALKSLR